MVDQIFKILEKYEENPTVNKFLIKNSDGKKSVTMTAFVLGFIVVNLKLIFSGATIGGLVLAPFSGVEYAASVTALGAIYVLRRQSEKQGTDDSKT
jgi:hypothetical protein